MVEAGTACATSVLGKRRDAASSPLAEDFECAVCCDLLLDPVVAPCGHDMCSHCYRRWVASFGIPDTAFCPLCRCSLPGNLAICLRLKKTIGHLYPDAVERRRKEIKQQDADDADAAEHAVTKPSSEPQQSSLAYPQGSYIAELWAAATPHSSLIPALVVTAHLSGSPQGLQSMPDAQQPRAVAEGMPVLSHICMAHAAGSTPCWSSTMQACSFAGTTTVMPAATAATRQAWQTAADGAERLQMARAIIDALQSRGLHLSLGPKLADAVRLLELMLYRTAPNKPAYMDPSSLDSRIEAAVHQRAAAAAARRARLDAATAN